MFEIYKKLARLLTPRERRNGIILFLMMIVGAVFEVIGVGAIPVFVGVISIPERLLEIGAVRWIYDYLNIESPEKMVYWAALGLILIFLIKNVYLSILSYFKARYSANRQVHLSNRLFRAYLHTSYTFHLQRNTAELLRNTNIEAANITGSVLLPLMVLIMEFMVLVFIFVLLFIVEPLVTIATFFVLGSFTLAIYKATKRKVEKYAKEEQIRRKQSVKAVNQGLGGIKDAKILGRELFFLRSFEESTLIKARAAQFKEVVMSLPRLLLETLAVLGMLGASGILLAQGRPVETLIPTLTLLAMAVVRLMPSFTKINSNLTSLKWGERALDVVYDDLMELEARENDLKERHREGSATPLPFEKQIVLEDVHYIYDNAAESSLKRITLSIPRYATVGFVGPSGAGKTTIVDVILGLLTPTQGRVLVDGVDIQSRLRAWQNKIGYIPQSIYLTDDTIRRNVAFGLGDHEISDETVWEAIDAAQLRDLVESLPEGLDTVVGERGVRLSGGQRQRIGIARALYHKPEVLVMDEATSALDTRTERNILQALESLRGRLTMITIAHRLTTVQDCDTLFFLDAGHLVASGTYNELLETCPGFIAMTGESIIDTVNMPVG